MSIRVGCMGMCMAERARIYTGENVHRLYACEKVWDS